MQTVQVVAELLGVVVLFWLVTTVMLSLMGGSIPWPYPRHWRWGAATLDGVSASDDPALERAHVVLGSAERQGVDWLDHNLRRN